MPRPKHPLKPRELVKMLKADGWVWKRNGPGDHVQYVHPTKPGRASVDMGAREIPLGTLRQIYRSIGWDW